MGGQARSLGGVATALTILLGIAGAASLLVSAAFFNRSSVIDDPFSLTQQEADDADGFVAGSFGLYILVAIAVVVLWLVWQFRHAKNAEALGKRDGLGAGWAIGGWFIPLGNLVLGPLQLFQSAKWSDTTAPPGQGRVPGALVLWWVLFVVQGLFGFAGGFQPDEANTLAELDDLQSQDRVAGLGALVTAAAAVAAIVMVRQVTQRQRDALRQRGLAM